MTFICQVYYERELSWVDPLIEWKRLYVVRQYRDKAAELRARQFIEHKLRQHNKVSSRSLGCATGK
jgi:hypothetical protein